MQVRVAGHDLEVVAAVVEGVAGGLDPEPVREHYVVVGTRRFPPKQLFSEVTGIDRADFTTHQARRTFRRLGFGVHRLGGTGAAPPGGGADASRGPRGGTDGDRLAPYAGRWVAEKDHDVLFADERPEAVIEWLRVHDQRADALFRVPAHAPDAGSATVQPS